MKATVDDSCISCGLCEEVCPEVFEIGDDGMAIVKVNEISPDDEACSREAAESCPVDAIHLEE